jgi:endoglucanase
MQGQDAALDYADAPGATAATVKALRAAYLAGAESSGNLGAIIGNQDPYLAYMPQYTWGSNSVQANTGDFLAEVVVHKLDAANADVMRAASRFVHYLHGTNPLSLVYLTNMGAYGAENGATQIFHTWLADGSAAWDQVGVSSVTEPSDGYQVAYIRLLSKFVG